MPIILQNPIPGQATTTIGWWNLSAMNDGPGRFMVTVQWRPGGVFSTLLTAAGGDKLILAAIQANVPAAAGTVT